jgi:hypothetical protein
LSFCKYIVMWILLQMPELLIEVYIDCILYVVKRSVADAVETKE